MAIIKKGLLPKFEIIIIAVFFFSFILVAMSKCGDIKQAAEDKLVSNTITEQKMKDSLSAIANALVSDTLISKKDTVYITKAGASTSYGRLYITINNLKLRTGPNLGDSIILQLPLFEEVEFMNEVTDSIYEINLGYEVAREPWVKIKTKKGKEGWVFGAGVNYYKKKRQGVIE